MTKKDIGKYIKYLREERYKATQADFATKIGWDRTYLSRVENGKQNITIENILCFCEAIDINVGNFFKEIEKRGNVRK